MCRRPDTQALSPLARLSPRWRELWQLVVVGRSSAEIGDIPFLSPKPVEAYRSRLIQKLGAVTSLVSSSLAVFSSIRGALRPVSCAVQCSLKCQGFPTSTVKLARQKNVALCDMIWVPVQQCAASAGPDKGGQDLLFSSRRYTYRR